MSDKGHYPDIMTSLPCWVLWRLEQGTNNRLTKVPYIGLYNGYPQKASSTNPDTWRTFEEVSRAYEKKKDYYSGLGFVFSDSYGFIFIDIDHCINNGELDARANDILSELGNNAFCEISQSGTGLHLFIKGIIPKSFKNPRNNVEMYGNSRFCAMTGNVYLNNEPSENPEALSRVYEKYRTMPHKLRERTETHQRVLLLSDEDIIKRATDNSVSGEEFKRLLSGDICGYASKSEADLRLCQILAFWANRDENTILRIIKASGAYRPKWDREDYSQRTISIACNSVSEDLTEFISRKREEERKEYEKALLLYW